MSGRLLRAGFQLGRFDSRLLCCIGYCSRDRIVRLVGVNDPRRRDRLGRVGRRRDLCLRQSDPPHLRVRRYRCRSQPPASLPPKPTVCRRGEPARPPAASTRARGPATRAPRRRRSLRPRGSRRCLIRGRSARRLLLHPGPDCLRRRRPLERVMSIVDSPSASGANKVETVIRPAAAGRVPPIWGARAAAVAGIAVFASPCGVAMAWLASSARMASISARSASNLFVNLRSSTPMASAQKRHVRRYSSVQPFDQPLNFVILYPMRVTRRLIAVPIPSYLRRD